VANIDQLSVRADGGGGNVILNSAYALVQGLYPSTKKSEITLANGTTVIPPLGGYQYIPGKSVKATICLLANVLQWNLWIFGRVHFSRAG